MSKNPGSIFHDLDDLMRIGNDQFEVLYSGNSKKILTVTIEKPDMTMILELTYRRTNNYWVLDGIYDSHGVGKLRESTTY